MTRLDELIIALAATIVSYCEIKTGDKHPLRVLREGERNGIIWNYPSFEEITKQIDKASKIDAERTSFLTYLKEEILLLTEYSIKKEPLSDSELDDLYSKINRLLLGFKTLLSTKQSTKVTVHYTSKTGGVNLAGLLNTSKVGGTYCNTGICLKKEVFDRFNLDTEYETIGLNTFIKSLCSEYQNTLLVVSQSKATTQPTKTINKLEPPLPINKKQESNTTLRNLEEQLAKALEKVTLQQNALLNLENKIQELNKTILDKNSVTTEALRSKEALEAEIEKLNKQISTFNALSQFKAKKTEDFNPKLFKSIDSKNISNNNSQANNPSNN